MKKRALDRFFGSQFHREQSSRTNRVLELAQELQNFFRE
jgi:hypothetical protein